MQSGLKGRRVAILAADGVERAQLMEARNALDAAGAAAVLLAPDAGEIRAAGEGDAAERFRVDQALGDAHAAQYAALVIPGGAASVDALRRDSRAVQLVRELMVADKPVATIGEGAAVLVAAGVVRGRTVASSPALEREIVDAGGEWVDEAVRVDGKLVTSRGAGDLRAFDAAIVREFADDLDQARVDELSEESFPASDAPPGPISIGVRSEPEARP